MEKIKHWLQASRLPSQLYIFLPLLLGQALVYARYREISLSLFILIHLFGLLIQLIIVYANDYADIKVDQHNHTYNIFSGGSRVLVEEKIRPLELLRAVKILFFLILLLGSFLTISYLKYWSFLFIFISLFLLWAYSYYPFKLSYRGGGEILQMIGVGALLPLFAYYIQLGHLDKFPWIILLVLLPNHLASAFSTALPDYPADYRFNKRTVVVLFKPLFIKKTIIFLNYLSIFFLLIIKDLVVYPFNLYIISLPFLINTSLFFLIKNSKAGNKQLFAFVFLNILQLILFLFFLTIYFFAFSP